MTKRSLAYNASLFQELDSQLRNLDSLLFQACICANYVEDIWRRIITSSCQGSVGLKNEYQV